MTGAEGAVTLRTAVHTPGHTPHPMSIPGIVPGRHEPVAGCRLEGTMELLAAAKAAACNAFAAAYAGKELHQNTWIAHQHLD